jgi:hypothetical protein
MQFPTPEPEKPVGHAPHVRLPIVLVQVTAGDREQPPLFEVHSVMNKQTKHTAQKHES